MSIPRKKLYDPKKYSENKKVALFILVVKMTELWKFMVLERNHVLHGLAWWLWCMAVFVDTTKWSNRAHAVDPHAGGDFGLWRR